MPVLASWCFFPVSFCPVILFAVSQKTLAIGKACARTDSIAMAFSNRLSIIAGGLGKWQSLMNKAVAVG